MFTLHLYPPRHPRPLPRVSHEHESNYFSCGVDVTLWSHKKAAVKDWVRDVSVSEVNGTTLAGASYYAAGDYTMPHTDKAGGHKVNKITAILPAVIFQMILSRILSAWLRA